jgi:transposase InsO family protein
VLVELGVVEQRLQAVKEVLDGATVTDVARRNKVARQTVHEWLRRYAAHGLAGLIDKSSKPDHSPHQMAPGLEARIVEMRHKHPGWGPRTIGYQFAAGGVDPVPGRTSIYRCLVRHRLIEPAPRRRRRQDYKRWERSHAMELWQMDIVGRFFLADGTELCALTGIDDHSRFCVSAHLMPRATAKPVCEALRLALLSHGLPKAILSDNGKVFTARFGTGKGPVLFDRICHDNGIRHLLTAPYSPTTTGKVERFHKTLRAEFLAEHDRRYQSIEELQAALDSWVGHYNTLRPHQSVGMRPPIERFRLGGGDELAPELVDNDGEPPEEELPPALTRRVGQDGRIHLGGFPYGVGRWLTGEVVEITLADGLVEVSHRGTLVATHAQHHREGARQLAAHEPRQRAARKPTNGPSVRRRVHTSGSVSFAGFNYRVGNPYIGSQVDVAVVANTVEFSLDGQVVKRQPIRHDRQKEFGAFSRPLGKPRTHRSASPSAKCRAGRGAKVSSGYRDLTTQGT